MSFPHGRSVAWSNARSRISDGEKRPSIIGTFDRADVLVLRPHNRLLLSRGRGTVCAQARRRLQLLLGFELGRCNLTI